MNERRNFLKTLVGGVAIAAAVQFPFRVYSFPHDVIIPKSFDEISADLTKAVARKDPGLAVWFNTERSELYMARRRRAWQEARDQVAPGFDIDFHTYEQGVALGWA